jgi:hypothetical protein
MLRRSSRGQVVIGDPGRGARVTGVVLAPEDHHLCDGERIGMRNRQQRGASAHSLEPAGGAAMKPELRRAAVAYHLDVLPQHLLRVAGAEGLHRRFLGGETPGEMDRGFTPALAVRDFAVGEAAVQEAIAVARERRGNTWDVRGVNAQPDDGRHDKNDTADRSRPF